MHRVLLLCATALLAAACKKPADTATPERATAAAAPAVKVETAPVELRQMPKNLTLTGSVLAQQQSEVAANVSGRITRTYVERGQPIRKGDVIALVDAKAAEFQAAAASAQLHAADTQVEQARVDCARADTLHGQGALTDAEYQRQKSQCTAQLHTANAARAQADLASKLAGDTQIRSPIDGVVGERFVNVGEYVGQATKVASVFAINEVRVSISVPEAFVGQVREGQPLEVQVSAHPGRSFPAVVRYVSPALRANTRDLIIEAVAKNPDHALRPGMFATVLLVTGEEELPTVPVEAVKVDGTVRRLFLAREGSAYELVIRTGVQKEGRIAVYEALRNEDRVIVKPPPGLRDGTAIQ
jgi:membrane fusion protein (multidrug efflux system)